MTDKYKKRILFCGEASFLNTGFSTYYRELLPRLAETGKYEIAEMGSYAHQADERIYDFIRDRWKFYGVQPIPTANRNSPDEIAFADPKNQSPRCGGQNTCQFGDYRFPFALADFKPDIVCTPPDELVMTSNGYKPIKDISAGDYVLSHTGKWRQVIRSMRRQFSGKLRYIYANGMAEPLRLTSEHPVLVYKKRKQTNQKKSWKDIYDGISPEFVPACEVQDGDLVVLPSIHAYHSCEFNDFDLWVDVPIFGYYHPDSKDHVIVVSDFLDNYIEEDHMIRCANTDVKSHRIPKFIRVLPDLARLIGYIISDGNIDNTGVRITFNLTEERFANDACQIFNKLFNVDASYHQCSDRKAFRVDANSVLLAEFMRKWLGDKNIPIELWNSENIIVQQLISGMIRGDGCYKKNTINYTSVDKHVAYNLRMLYAKLGISSTLVKRRNVETDYGAIDVVYDVNVNSVSNVRRIHNFVNKHNDIEDYIDDDMSDKSCCSVQDINGHIVASVRRTRYVDYRGMVYNLEVDKDNSYTLQYNVHNCDIRDWWMLEYIERSAFRPYFKWIAMPTVDAEPQKEEWIDTYRTANLCLAYSDFGVHVLKSYPGVKVWPEPTRPGVDLDVFHPMDQKELKKDWLGCQDDVKVILMVARNQSRKLFPDALDGFALMKERYKGERVVDKAVLVLHSSWPDNQFSYDYPRHIARMHTGYYGLEYYNKPTPVKGKKGKKVKQQGGIIHDVFQTYMCRKCGHIFLGWAIHLHGKPVEHRNQNEAGKIYVPCQKCGENWATTPDTSCGFEREELARLYAMADMFIQVTICEGDGMPIQEAKACGCPTLVVDYSAMAEKGRFHDEYVHFQDKDFDLGEYTVHEGGVSIPVGRYYYEPETSCKRALPDVSALADEMYKLLVDDERREQMRIDARQCAEDNYDWDKLAKKWEYIIDRMDIIDRSTTWNKPHEMAEIRTVDDIPEGLDDSAFIDYLYLNVLRYPRVDEQGKQHWMAALQAGQDRASICRAFEQVISQEVQHQNAVNSLLAEPQESPDELQGEVI